MRRGPVIVSLGCLLACAGFGFTEALAQVAPPAIAGGSAESPLVQQPTPAIVSVVLKTSLGDIVVALETERARITAANFLHYVDQKRFDGSEFYRAVAVGDDGKYGLIQGGLRGNLKREFKPIAHESTTATGLSHIDGAISMARREPGTATSDFFIIVGGLVSLDAQADGSDPGYAVFGHVVNGMEVVHAILGQPTSPTEGEGVMKGQILAMPVKILTARRAE